jgi:hypothetical protein
MIIPGSNILKMALTVIAQQSVQYFRFTGRVNNDIGNFINAYADPVILRGSWQFIPRRLYVGMGLDLQKTYVNFYTPNNVADIQRGAAGDQLVFDSRKYQVESLTPWLAQDGWVCALCVDIGAA